MTKNIQLRKFIFKDGVELVKYQSHKLIPLIYSKFRNVLLLSTTFTVFSNTRKYQISKDVF